MGLVQSGEEMPMEVPNINPWYLLGGQQRDRGRSFTVVHGRRTRGGGQKLKKGEILSSYMHKEKKRKKKK